MTLPPGPPKPHLAHTAGWVTRPGPWSRKLRKQFGDTFTVHVDNRLPWVMLSDPEDVKRVFTGDPNILHAGEGNSVLKPLLGPKSVLLLDGPEHMRERKAMLPAFHGERMQAYGELIRDISEREVAGWPTGLVETRPRTQALTLEVIMRAVFGSRDDRLRQALAGMLDALSSTPLMMFAILAPPRQVYRVFNRHRAPIDTLLNELIAQRRGAEDLEEREDILSLLLAHTDMDDAALHDELLTLLAAGHETTATALAWALERLAHDPEAWARLRSGDEDYLDAVCKETLRIRPVVPGVIRALKAPFEINGYELPAGVAVVPNILLMHTREDIYPDPFAFRPERFLERPAGTYTWIPFGGGVRRCLGASFALFEMKVALRAVASAIEELSPASRRAERPARRAVTLVPHHEGRVIVARRAAPAPRAQLVPSGR